jgi:hypothetical protein
MVLDKIRVRIHLNGYGWGKRTLFDTVDLKVEIL